MSQVSSQVKDQFFFFFFAVLAKNPDFDFNLSDLNFNWASTLASWKGEKLIISIVVVVVGIVKKTSTRASQESLNDSSPLLKTGGKKT
ncbi:hypothetical protein BpHYR1_004042 [Brachionus plicatilis]|uniref:Uncharacterized protein n=1 Tax=Brachionus plicatilis TaxID=10195 RepID=A0A3M7RSP2_BRAPC|nr:hypothetical protein BpHYR1_004042 [Brachionus plicatilis]